MANAITDKSSSNGTDPNANANESQPALITSGQGIGAIAAAEQANAYRSFGPAYVGTGIAGDLSVEIGITTGSGEKQQRSGIGIYLRSDHVAHRYSAQLFI
jgi:hypothetical protein